jgi:hypothetical protein
MLQCLRVYLGFCECSSDLEAMKSCVVVDLQPIIISDANIWRINASELVTSHDSDCFAYFADQVWVHVRLDAFQLPHEALRDFIKALNSFEKSNGVDFQ